MSENKTKPATAGVDDYIPARANEQQYHDCQALMKLF